MFSDVANNITVYTPHPFRRRVKLNFIVKDSSVHIIPTGTWIEETGSSRIVLDENSEKYKLIKVPLNNVRELFVSKYGEVHFSRYFGNLDSAYKLEKTDEIVNPSILLEEYFDSIAGSYASIVTANSVQTYMRETTVSFLSKHLKKGCSLLDLGCGPMLETSIFREDCKLEGIDISKKMLAEASARLPSDSSVVLKKTDISLNGDFGTYEVIFSSFGLVELVQPEDLRKFLTYHLKKGGKFIFAAFNRFGMMDIILSCLKGNLHYAAERMRGRMYPGGSRFPLFVQSCRLNELIPENIFKIVEKRGLCFFTPPYNYGFFRGKKRFLKILQKLDSIFSASGISQIMSDYVLVAAEKI